MLLFQNIFHVFIFSQEFCILLFGFCFFWFVSGSVGQNVAWIKLKSELLYGFMSSDLRLFAHFSSSPKKDVLKELSIILLTHPKFAINLISSFCTLDSISTFCTRKNSTFLHCLRLIWRVLSQWACWNFCMCFIQH